MGKPPSPDDASALPVTPSDDDVDLNDEDTDTVDEHPVATERHPHVVTPEDDACATPTGAARTKNA